jgi:tetratricopeptide (TPR) repeat protein
VTAGARAGALSGGFLGLHVLAAYGQPVCVWGVDALAFHGPWLQLAFVVVGVLLVWDRARQTAVDAIAASLERVSSARWGAAGPVVLLLGGVAAFATWPSAVHLLGDGDLYLRELPLSAVAQRTRLGHEPLTFWLLDHLFRSLGAGDPLLACRLYSYASGALYLLLVPVAAATLGRRCAERAVLTGLLLTPGFVQLFFGYVETYSMLAPGMLAYLVLGCRVLRGQQPLWVAAVALGLITPLHFTLVTLGPSLLGLALLRHRRAPGPTLASVAVAPGLALGLLLAMGIDPIAYVANLRGSHLLPLWGDLQRIELYHLLAPAHVIDFLNQQLLVAPAALLVLALVPRAVLSRQPEPLFLLSAGVFPLAFTFVANPEIGLFRDWDVLALPALPMTLWAGRALLDRLSPQDLAPAALTIVVAAGLHTAAWVALNADRAAAVGRFEQALEHCTPSSHARSYGWETLGIHHREEGDLAAAQRAYEQAVAAAPDHPRHWVSLGHLALEQGRLAEAVSAYGRALQIRPQDGAVRGRLGLVQARMGDYPQAIVEYRRALRDGSDDAELWHNLGDACSHAGRLPEAIAAFRRAVELRPTQVASHLNLGIVLENAGDRGAAESAYRRLLELAPSHLHGHCQLGGLLMDQQRWDEAVAAFHRALTIDGDFAQAHYNLALIHRRLGQQELLRRHARRLLEVESADAAMRVRAREWLR